MTKHLTLISLFVIAAACSAETDTADTTARGVAQYPGSGDSDGDAPPPQSMDVDIHVEGTGSIDGLDPECSLDGLGGAFVGVFEGTGDIDSDGAYVAALASSDATLHTPSGCEIPSIQIESFTRVVVRARIDTTTPNCETYCSAKARHEAETECGASPEAASCRAETEAAYTASCETSCAEPTSHAIVAETELSVQEVAELNAAALSGTALGEIAVNLTFDHIETADGSHVDERP